MEEDRIVFGSLEEKSAAAHIGDVAVAVAVEELGSFVPRRAEEDNSGSP